MNYEIKLDIFQGPFDLLVHLISSQKIDIFDISVHQIIDDYLAYLKKMKELNLEVTSQFILTASILLELKSQALLPAEEEEEEEIFETKEILLSRLIEYKAFKNISQEFLNRIENQSKNYPRQVEIEERFRYLRPDFLKDVTAVDIMAIYTHIIAREMYKKLDTSFIAPIVVSVEEKMDEIIEKLKISKRETFRSICASARKKIEIIAYFLALLELYKQDLIELSQLKTFGEIRVRLKDGNRR